MVAVDKLSVLWIRGPEAGRTNPASGTAYGVDGCRAGWLYFALARSREPGWGIVGAIEELVSSADDSDLIFVDIPIGLLPEPLAKALRSTVFKTGDDKTDRLLETARHRIAPPKEDDRQVALEKLWDAFERLKTLEPGADKRRRADALLDQAAAPGTGFRKMLGEEALALTRIGNTFRIRHSEVWNGERKFARACGLSVRALVRVRANGPEGCRTEWLNALGL